MCGLINDMKESFSTMQNNSGAFAGVQVANNSDPNWYVDSGATNHMTQDARSLAPTAGHAPSDGVVIDNGASSHHSL